MKIKILITIILGISISVYTFSIWSLYFGKNNPQTGFEYLTSITGKFKEKPSSEIIFLGDSITARKDWNKLFKSDNILNAGISGNTTDDILLRLDPLLDLKPKKIFIMIGINDLSKGRDISYVLNNYKIITNKIKTDSPDTILFIESVLPINKELSPIGKIDSQKIIDLNTSLRSLADEIGATFINLYPNFVSKDNEMDTKYASDGVHPNANGYALLKTLLLPYLNQN